MRGNVPVLPLVYLHSFFLFSFVNNDPVPPETGQRTETISRVVFCSVAKDTRVPSGKENSRVSPTPRRNLEDLPSVALQLKETV